MRTEELDTLIDAVDTGRKIAPENPSDPRSARNCDKCGLPVAGDDDAVMLEILMGQGGLFLLGARPRHLLANEHCEGSPSRAQYLEGQPRDTRGYPYSTEAEPYVRAAYERLKAGDY